MKTRQSILFLTALAMISTLIACGASNSKAPAPPALSIAVLSGSGQSTSVGAVFTAHLLAWVTSDGSPMSGVTVTFTAPTSGAGGTFAGGANTATATTDDRGLAAAPVFTANTTAGTYAVIATVSGASAPASFSLTNTASSISVALNPAPPTSMQTGATATFTAVVTNDSTNSGVTWSCMPLNACGSFNPTTSTGSTATTSYTAPAAIPSGGSVTITAAAVQNTSASASAIITISTTAPISVSFSPAPPTLLKPGATTPLTAVVTNDSTNSGVTWSCTPLNACGSFNPTTSTGSSATTTYTAPATIPSGGSVTVKATAVKSASASALANIAISASTLADGVYVFTLASSQSGNHVAGAFRVTNGTITGGEQDFISPSAFSDLINGTGSSISTTANGNLQITLKTCNGKDCTSTDANVGVNGVETLHGTLVSASRALITEFDTFATSIGSLDLQVSPVTAPAHGYAFFTSGFTQSFTRLGIGGVINVDGTASNGTVPISGTGSVFDINDAFAITQNQSFSPSSVTTPDAFGRVIFALNPSAASGISPISLVGYIVDSGHIHLVETIDTLLGITGGEALGQGNNTGKFNTASVSSSSFVFGATGGNTLNQFQMAGVLVANSGGTVSGTLNCNDLNGTCTQTPTTFTGGAYTVDATGRVTLTNLTSNAVTLQLYLSGSGTGTVVSMDMTDELSGLAYQQTAGSSFSGTYGMNATGFDSSQLEFDDVGPISAGTGSLTGTHTIDQNYGSPPAQTPGLSVSGTFIPFASDVLTGTITGLEVLPPNTNVLTFTYYIIDTTKVVAIETDTKQLTLINFELKQ